MKRLLLMVLLLSAAALGQTQIASEAFTYSNGNIFSVSGGNWTQSGGNGASTVTIVSNALSSASANGVYGRWTGAGSFTADQYSQITVTSSNGTTRWIGVAVRMGTSTSGFTGYVLSCASTNCKLEKYVSGALTTLQAATAHGISINGKTVRLSITGTTLTPLVNGATPAGFSATYTDPAIASGTPGWAVGSQASSSIGADDWSGGITGNPSAATPTLTAAPVQTGGTITFSTSSGGCGPYIYWNTTGAPTGGDNHSTTATMGSSTTTYYAKVIGCPGFTDSSVGSRTYTINPTPVLSPGAGTYLNQQSISFSCSSGAGYYTTDGSTPTTGSTAYSGAFNSVASGAETVKAACLGGGNGDGAVATAAYSIAPADVLIVSDNFSSYYDAEIAPNHSQQPPLDTVTTQGKWKAVGSISGDSGTEEVPALFMTPVRPGIAAAITSGYAVGAASSSQVRMSVYTGRTGFSQDQWAKGKAVAGAGGVGVSCATDGSNNGYYFVVSPNPTPGQALMRLGKVIGGVESNIELVTFTNAFSGDLIELRRLGDYIQALVNGSVPSGFASQYLVTDGISGAPCVASRGGYVSDWSAGNVGAADATSTSTYTPTYPAYSDSFGAGWTRHWPWQSGIMPYTPSCDWTGGVASCGLWGGNIGAATVDGYTGLGVIPGAGFVATMHYRGGEFGQNQYQRYKVGIDPDNPHVNNWFSPLKHRTLAPGTTGTPNCVTEGTLKNCYDSEDYYPGVETMGWTISAMSVSAACGDALKAEYICTPFMHVTKDTRASSPGNQVHTVAGSFYTPRKGDEIFTWYEAPYIGVACKGNPANLVYWQPGHAYSVNDYIVDGNGFWQKVKTSGTSGGSAPTWYAGWTSATASGDTTNDGSVVWEYYGEPCPTTGSFSAVIHAADTDLQANSGTPALWFGQDATAQPIFYDWSAGTIATGNDACSLIGVCNISVGQSSQWIMW